MLPAKRKKKEESEKVLPKFKIPWDFDSPWPCSDVIFKIVDENNEEKSVYTNRAKNKREIDLEVDYQVFLKILFCESSTIQMFKRSANQALMQKVSSCCLYIECDDRWISAVVLTKNYAVTALHCIPDTFRQIGLSVVLCDADGQHHNVHIHGLNKISDYIVFKKADGVFDSVPEMTYPMPLDQYIVVGFPSGEKKSSVRFGHISSLSDGSRGFFYGDSGGLPGFSGGGVFYASNGALMGIARGSDWDGKDTKQYGDVLEMISVQVVLNNIEFACHQPFSV